MLFILNSQCYLGAVFAFDSVNIQNNHHLQKINKLGKSI